MLVLVTETIIGSSYISLLKIRGRVTENKNQFSFSVLYVQIFSSTKNNTLIISKISPPPLSVFFDKKVISYKKIIYFCARHFYDCCLGTSHNRMSDV